MVRIFGSVEALRAADFEVRAGEVSALIGDNGAWKSTLVRILAGADKPNAGIIKFKGKVLALDSPIDAPPRRSGTCALTGSRATRAWATRCAN